MDHSFSNTLSKGSVRESDSIWNAYQNDAESRLGEGVRPEAISNEEIHRDDDILETYRVEDDAIHGGMGSVWRVHHLSWNNDLAMKRPQPRFFAEGSDQRKADFVAECEHWINLGFHPHIVSCYYVREIGGVPTIFSEWMDGGSLKDAIKSGRLYEGTEQEVQARILDIAVQTAWGLQYSHERGLIHQDVKPGNILLTKAWDAKVADFGLAKAQSQLTDGKKAVSTGYTLAYCPKEQVEGAKAEAWMDVYAWALTVLEAFCRTRSWETGDKGLQAVEAAELPMPLKALLRGCIASELRDFRAVLDGLYGVYEALTGHACATRIPAAAPDNADSLNNRALSFMDLGFPETALSLWKLAQQKGRTPESDYNYALFAWYKGENHFRAVYNAIETFEEEDEQAALRKAFDETVGAFEAFLAGRVAPPVSQDPNASASARLEALRRGRRSRDNRSIEPQARAFSRDGRYAAITEEHLWLWAWIIAYDIERNKRMFSRFLGISPWINRRAFIFSAGAKYLLTCVLDSLVVFDAKRGRRLCKRFMQDEVLYIRPGTEDRLALCVMKAGAVRPFDIEDQRNLPMARRLGGQSGPGTLPPKDPATGKRYDLYEGAPDAFLRPRWALSRVSRSEELLEREKRFQGLIAQSEQAFREKRYADAYDLLEQARLIKSKRYAPECRRILSWFSQVCEKRGLKGLAYIGTHEPGPQKSLFMEGTVDTRSALRGIMEDYRGERLFFTRNRVLALKSGKYRLYDDRGCLLRDGFRIPGKRRMWDRLYEGNLIADRFGLWDPLDDHYAVRWQYPQYVSELTPGKFRRLGIEITVDSRRGLCGAFLKYYKTRNRNPFVVDRSPLLVFSTQTGALLDDIDINEALGIHLTHLLEGGWIRHGFRLYRLRDLYDKGEKLTVVLPQTGDPMFFDHITRLQAENKATNRTEIYQMEWEYDLCQEVSEPDNAHPL